MALSKSFRVTFFNSADFNDGPSIIHPVIDTGFLCCNLGNLTFVKDGEGHSTNADSSLLRQTIGLVTVLCLVRNRFKYVLPGQITNL